MLVSDIVELSKTKVRLYIDNQPAFALYKSEVKKYGIREGGELPDELYDTIVNGVLAKRAILRAMNLLKSRDYTEHRLRTKLSQSYYPAQAAESALDYVKSYGYVDDLRYSESYIECKSSSKSKKQIFNDLIKKGVSKDNIEKAFELCGESDNLPDETQLIRKLLQKKHYDSDNATYEETQKIIAFLYRKGFSTDNIYKTVRQF